MPPSSHRDEGAKLNKHALPAPAVAFVALTGIAGVALLVVSCLNHIGGNALAVGVASVAAFLCASQRIRLSNTSTVSTGVVIVFAALTSLGVAEACVTAAASGLALVVINPEKRRNPLPVIIFGVTSLVVTTAIAGAAYTLAGGQSQDVTYAFGLAALAAAVTYHVTNCLLVSVISHLAGGASLWATFRSHLVNAAIAFYAAAGWAVLIRLAADLAGVWVLAAGVPVLYCIHEALKQRVDAIRAALEADGQ